MAKIFDNILQTIGRTPLVRLNKIGRDLPGKIVLKLEFFNPCASVKDRIGVSMIEALEKQGRIKPNTVLVEPTSGNTGIGARLRRRGEGLPPRPHDARHDEHGAPAHADRLRRGARADRGRQGHEGRDRARRERDRRERPGRASCSSASSAIPRIPRSTAARRPRRSGTTRTATVDILVSGIGTGGTITGVGEVIKKRKPEFRCVAVEPAASPVLSGGQPGPHKIAGHRRGLHPGDPEHEDHRRDHPGHERAGGRIRAHARARGRHPGRDQLGRRALRGAAGRRARPRTRTS